jgi:hypothetical protein
VEGITIFSLVLEKNGYTRLTVSKNTKGVWKFNVDEKTAKNKKFIVFDSSDQEKTAILINLFNNEIKELPPNLQKQAMEMNSIPDDHDNANGSIVKAFLITKSGSEGISLRNVRNVHIIEPYWNYTRVLQTIGRAVRAHSHSDLPKEKQTVTPYVYVMEFSKTQLKQKGELLSSDRGMTTDQSLFDIAKRKDHIITQINSLLKSVSVDCSFNISENADYKCFAGDENYNTDTESTIASDSQIHIKKVSIKGVVFILDEYKGVLYDYEAFKKYKTTQPVGFLEKTPGSETMKLRMLKQ